MLRWGIGLIALAVLSAPAAPAHGSGYAPASVAFTFADARINESSGAASATLSPGVLFTHNDSGDSPRFFAVGPTGQTLAIFSVSGAYAADWEDMAHGPASSGTGSSLYLADIGNNLRNRRVLDIYEVAEPVVSDGGDATLPVVAVRHLSYEDIPHDAEAVMIDPRSGDIVVVAKEFHGLSNVYVARGDSLVRVATVAMPLHMSASTASVLGPAGGTQITGGAISDDASRVALRTYTEAFEWTMKPTFAETFASPPRSIPLPRTTQGEAITYAPNGDLLTTSEGVHAPVHRLTVL